MFTKYFAKKNYNDQLKLKKFARQKKLNLKNKTTAIIDLKINSLNKVFSSFDINAEQEISKKFTAFLLKEIRIIPINLNILLLIFTNTKLNKQQLINALKHTFSFKIVDLKLKIKRQKIKAVSFFGLSLLSLLLTFITKQFSTFFVDETLLILSWFFLWEGSNIMFEVIFNLKRKLYNYLRLYNSKIEIKKQLNN